ncbi:MAG: metal-dependent hydrolase [Sphingomonadaceae bacterium]
MDNLTHSLVGALIGQAGLKRKTGLAMPALVIGANIPDVDAACFFWLDGLEHLAFRRGITHGPIAWVLLPLLLAGVLWWFDRWQERRGKRPEVRLPVRFGWLYALAFIACLTHPALDWLNVYGIRLLEPFSSQWFYGDTLFIIDVWLWLGMGFATWLSLRREKTTGCNWRRPARAALVGAVAYIGLNAGITYSNEAPKGAMSEPYPRVVIASPPPIAFWVRERIIQTGDGRWYSDAWPGKGIGYGYRAPVNPVCELPPDAASQSKDADAFLFWSRAPFAERADDGSVVIRDARFYDPRARGRFSVALPEVPCVELAAD